MGGRNVLASVILELGADVANFESDLSRAERIQKKYFGQMEKLATRTGAMIGAGVATAVVGITALIKKSINAADEMGKFSQKTGVAVDRLSGLQYAAKINDVQMGTLRGSLVKLDVALAKAAGGATQQQKVFRGLGIEYVTAAGKIRATDEVLLDVADKMSGMRDGAAKTALAVQLFGKAGAEMVPFLNQGAAGIEQLTTRAKALGLVITDDLAKGSDKFNDAMEDMGNMATGFGNAIAEQVVPGLAAMADRLVEAEIKGQGFNKAGEGTGRVLQKIVTGLALAKNAVELLISGFMFMAKTATAVFAAAASVVGNFLTYMKEAAKAAANPFDENTMAQARERFKANAVEIARTMVHTIGTAADEVKADYKGVVQDVSDAFSEMNGAVDKTQQTFSRAEETIIEYGNASEDAAKAAEKLAQAHKKFVGELDDVRAELAGPMAQAQRTYNKKMEELQELLDENVITVDEATEAQLLYGEQLKKTTEAIERQLTPAQQLIRDLEMEIDLVGASNEQRQRAIALRNVEADVTDKQRRKINALFDTLERDEAFQRQADAWESAWLDATDGVYEAWGDFIASGLSDWKDFGDALERNAERFLGNLSRQFAETLLTPQAQGGGFQSAVNGINQGSMYGQGGTGTTAQGWMNAAGSAYAGWQASQQGSTGETVMNFTAAGAQIGGVWGAVIGAVVGLIVAWANKPKPPQIRLAGENGDIARQEMSFNTVFGMVRGGSRGGIHAADYVEPIQQFDRGIYDLVSSFENAEVRLARIRHALSEWEYTEQNDDAGLDDVLENRFQAIMGTFDIAIQQFVAGGLDFEERLRRLGDALAAESAFMQAGIENVDFAEFLRVVDTMGMAGEETSETVHRVVGGMLLVSGMLDTMGQELDMTGAEFARFTASVTEAAGGLEAAGELMARYFDNFYSPEEIIATNLDSTVASAHARLGAVGLTAGVTKEEFRALFEELLPTLSAEALVQWLEAADAIQDLIDAEEQLMRARLQEFASLNAYSDFITDLNDAISGGELTQFEQDLRGIRDGSAQLIQRYYEVARAAGRAAPSIEDLGRVTIWAARQFDMAVSRLRNRIQSLVNQLQGSALERIEREIALLEEQAGAASDFNSDAFTEAQDRYEMELQYLKQLKDFMESLLLSELSPLNPADRFTEALSQYQTTLAAAQGGDVEALGRLPDVIRALLGEASTYLGRNDQYTALFDSIMAAQQALIDAGPQNVPVGVDGGPIVTIVPSEELLQLYADRDAALLEAENAQRLELAGMILSQLAELVRATGEDLFDIAEAMGLDLAGFIGDLGIDITELTVETVQQLAGVAAALDVELTALAQNIGMALGELTDTQSLLNDAFEAEIDSLPDELEELLEPLLRDIESATTEADANAAIERMRDAVGDLPAGIRNQLAPFLGLDQVDDDALVGAVDLTTAAINYSNELLGDILTALTTPIPDPTEGNPGDGEDPALPPGGDGGVGPPADQPPPDTGPGPGGPGGPPGGPIEPPGIGDPNAVNAIIRAINEAAAMQARAYKDAQREMEVRQRSLR